MSSCDQQFYIDRIAKVKALIEVWEDALLAIGQNTGVFSYTIDTGQSRQTVQRQDLDWMQDYVDGLYNKLATLNARVYGCGTVQQRPGW